MPPATPGRYETGVSVQMKLLSSNCNWLRGRMVIPAERFGKRLNGTCDWAENG